MKLGDHFPESIRKTFCDEHLKPGAVFKLEFSITKPPKVKRIILLGINAHLALVGYVFINTEMNTKVFHNSVLQSLQYPLNAEHSKYLDWDSYVDCSKIYEQKLDKLKNIFAENIGVHLGHVNKHDMTEIRKRIESARTISRKMKKRYGFSYTL